MKKRIQFFLNENFLDITENPAKTLLDYIRNDAGLKGTKEGCREGDCGACTVLIGEIYNSKLHYKSVNSCLYPLEKVNGKHVVTIEGLSDENLNPIQEEFNNEGASQCGFCTPGFVNSLTGYVIEHDRLEHEEAVNAIAGNICRCTGYASIKRTAQNVVDKFNSLEISSVDRINSMIKKHLLPSYFSKIELRLMGLITEVNLSTEDQIVGGGTDLYVQKATQMHTSNITLSSNLTNDIVSEMANVCIIGGTVTLERFKNSVVVKKYLPNLEKQLNLFASLPIRNSATIAGNFVNASPIGDSSIIFLALNATLKLVNNSGFRELPLNKFYRGYKNIDLKDDEFIQKIIFELPVENELFNFEKVSKREHLDIASVNTAIKIIAEDGIIRSVTISAGGVAPFPLVLKNTSEFLTGEKISAHNIREALKITQTEISPISDIRGSEKYKRILLEQLIKSHFIKLFPEYINAGELI